ncbi:hypothetical protein Landi51_02854 [Colletotrichum acutatum]
MNSFGDIPQAHNDETSHIPPHNASALVTSTSTTIPYHSGVDPQEDLLEISKMRVSMSCLATVALLFATISATPVPEEEGRPWRGGINPLGQRWGRDIALSYVSEPELQCSDDIPPLNFPAAIHRHTTITTKLPSTKPLSKSGLQSTYLEKQTNQVLANPAILVRIKSTLTHSYALTATSLLGCAQSTSSNAAIATQSNRHGVNTAPPPHTSASVTGGKQVLSQRTSSEATVTSV